MLVNDEIYDIKVFFNFYTHNIRAEKYLHATWLSSKCALLPLSLLFYFKTMRDIALKSRPRFLPRRVYGVTKPVTFTRWRRLIRALDLRLKRSWVRISAIPFSGNNLGQVVHMRVPLSRSSIIWYRSRDGDALRLASHWPCVSDFSGLSAYGLTA